jgi:peptidoglycan/xylan/chitin deacetylase (PgdA/CDA1 family)
MADIPKISAAPVDMRERLLYSPAPARPPIRWPGDARLALWISPNIEYYEYLPQEFNFVFHRMPTPDVQQYGLRDYGNRVGLWRFAELMDEYGIKPTVSLNTAVLEHFPEIARAMISRDWELMSHGLYNTRLVLGKSNEEEAALYAQVNEIMIKHQGRPPKGMLGPSLSATIDTPELMTDAGMIYSTDWQHDDQPGPILTTNGKKLVSVPYTYELNDGQLACHDLGITAKGWRDAFDVLWGEGETSGRVQCLGLHPYMVGQPHLIGLLRDFIDYARSHEGVWFAKAEEIAEHYIAYHYDEHVAHARALTGETA